MKVLTPIKAIREKCLNCVCGSAHEVKLCPCNDCSLYPFRFGKNPYTKRNYTDEQRADMSQRMKSLVSAKNSRQDV